MSSISSIEMRNLIFEALAIQDKDKTPRGCTFHMYGYRGCVSDLFAIVEHLATERKLIDKIVDIHQTAWGHPGDMLYYESNTSFTPHNIDVFYEELHYLIFQNVISPGAYGGYGDDLPYFHVTTYGLECLAAREILPHDPDGYIAKIKATGADEWEEFYIEQALKCYNAGAWNAAIVMLGLAGEYLAQQLISSLGDFIKNKENSLYSDYSLKISQKEKISTKYSVYDKFLTKLEKLTQTDGCAKYPHLQSLKGSLDVPTKSVFATFLRLTRNEVAHPTSFKLEKSATLMIFITYIKYCEIQHKYLSFYKTNS